MSEPPITLRQIAVAYHEAGWHPLELPARAKQPVPTGRTGYGGSDMTAAEIEATTWTGNIGLRMPIDVIGLDVDAYKGGDRTLAEMIARLGPLPITWISHSNRGDGSGIRFFRVPVGFAWVTALAGIEIIQRVHRYALVHPSIHPDGRPYGWADQTEGVFTDELPVVEDLPELPWAWIGELSRAQAGDVTIRSQAVDGSALDAFIEAHHRADQPSYVGTILAHFTERWQAGYSRHDTMQHCLIWAMECVRAGIAAARPTIQVFADQWVEAVSPDQRRAQVFSERRTTEFQAMLRHAVGKVTIKAEADILRLHDDIAGIPMHVPPVLEVSADEEDDGLPRPINWAEFVDRDEGERRWLVPGFWPWGRAMALWASAKVGKSELALWCAVKLALGEDPWSGKKIDPVEVAYFDFEMTPDDLDDRLSAFDIDPVRLGHLHYFQLPPMHALDTEAGGREIEKLVRRHGAQAVVLDTFGRAVAGEENAADTVRAFYQHAGSRLKRLGIGYLRLDHAGKDQTKGQRGSSAKRDDVDVVWSMKRGKTGEVALTCAGSSRLDWVSDLVVTRSEDDGAVSYSAVVGAYPKGTGPKAKELDELGVPVTATRREAETAIRAAGRKPGRLTVLCAALKYRAETAGTTRETLVLAADWNQT
jgi:hypothetical protein